MGEVVGPIAAMLILGWLFSALLTHLRKGKVMKAQIETRGRILEKIGAGQEMMDFMKTDAGQRMLESLPTEAAETPKEYSRILRSVQAGVVLLFLGIGIVLASEVFGGDPEASVIGAIVLALGVGFVLAGGASYWLSRNWGLLNGEQEAE